jgi:uncharacterized RDD family membrane protein YckC
MTDPVDAGTSSAAAAQAAARAAAHAPKPIPTAARAFQGLRAGVVTRTIAGAIDYALITTITLGTWVTYAVLLFLIDPRDYTLPSWPLWVFVVLGYCYMVLYLTAGWAITGRSVGSRLLGLRVVGRKGDRLGWPAAFVRAAFCTIAPYLLFWCAISREPTLRPVIAQPAVRYRTM